MGESNKMNGYEKLCCTAWVAACVCFVTFCVCSTIKEVDRQNKDLEMAEKGYVQENQSLPGIRTPQTRWVKADPH